MLPATAGPTDLTPRSNTSRVPPENSLLQHATEWKADVIVVGNSVKRVWLKKLFGETAMHVIQNATVPLFVSQ
jgi:nucleotide-binding universal stress UspA family protein